MKLPIGFRYAGVMAGIKAGRRDLALLASDGPAAAAGVFTVNRLCAAPVAHAARHVPTGSLRAVVVNSGNANAMTGPGGIEDERLMAEATARALGVSTVDVLTASTGSIGPRLPVDKIRAAAPALVAALANDEESFEAASEAIRTTDLVAKSTHRVVQVGGKPVTIAAMCKGSGMIHPQMATMLCFITTDAAISPAALQSALEIAVEESFNTITVDGDMSTNDSVIAMANGRSGASIESTPGAMDAFQAALGEVCGDLARKIAADGEGATKLLVVDVFGAPDRNMARDLARSVAGSSLVKSGMFGGDPSWGRVLASIGARAGSRNYAVDLSRISLEIQGTKIYDERGPSAFDRDALNTRMRES